MSPDLDAAIIEALDARATTTATSPDAWARIGRRATRRDRRRTAIVRVAAAAVIVVVALGGTVAVLARQGGESATVATSESGDDGAALESRAADDGIGESGTPAADLRVEQNQDGSVTFLRGDQVLGIVEVPDTPAGTRLGEDGTVTAFGIAAPGATQVRLSINTVAFAGTTATFTDPAAPGLVLFVAEDFVLGDFASWELMVESLDSAGNVISTSSNKVGGQ